jgi:protein-S-isoprenylcysteine O-methyltransferase Ste14
MRLAYSPMWSVSVPLGWAMFAVVVAGIAFAWWARIHLGALWSGAVTRKFNHRIVDTGPYALVRHPIYTGLLSAAIATGVARGAWPALAGALILWLGIWMKARLEERFLSEQLGSEYAAYRARVPMLVPFLKV